MKMFLIVALVTSALLVATRFLWGDAWFDNLSPKRRTLYIVSGLLLLSVVVAYFGDVKAVQICAGLAFGFVAWYTINHFVLIRTDPWKGFVHKEYHYWLGGALVLFSIIGLYTEDLQVLVRRIDRLDFGFLSFQTSTISNLQAQSFADQRSFFGTSLEYVYGLSSGIDSATDYLLYVASEDHEDRRSGLVDRHVQANLVISGLLAPLAHCADIARLANIDIELIREQLRPIPLHLRWLLQTKDNRRKLQRQHNELVRLVLEAHEGIKSLPFDKTGCPGDIISITSDTGFRDTPNWPFKFFLGDLSDDPNINLVIGALFMFNKNVDAAIEMLSSDEVTAEFRYNYDYVLGRLLFQTNRDAAEFYPPLQRMLDGAAKQIAEIDGKRPRRLSRVRRLSNNGDLRIRLEKLQRRAEFVRRTVKNQIAYYLAQAVAGGDESSLKWWNTAKTYADDLQSILKEPELRRVDLAAFMDTQGFVTLVAQAGKRTRDLNALRQALDKLCKAREIVTNALADKPVGKDTETSLRRSLSSVRRHIELANTLLREPEAC